MSCLILIVFSGTQPPLVSFSGHSYCFTYIALDISKIYYLGFGEMRFKVQTPGSGSACTWTWTPGSKSGLDWVQKVQELDRGQSSPRWVTWMVSITTLLCYGWSYQYILLGHMAVHVGHTHWFAQHLTWSHGWPRINPLCVALDGDDILFMQRQRHHLHFAWPLFRSKNEARWSLYEEGRFSCEENTFWEHQIHWSTWSFQANWAASWALFSSLCVSEV